MSKLQLKKELAALDREQLTEMILDAYSARKEIKEYFNFYLNPDPEKLSGKYFDVISKELKRTKRGGYSKARISFIRKQLKEFASFQPGADHEAHLMMKTIRLAMAVEIVVNFTDTLMKGIATIMGEMIEKAELAGESEKIVGELAALLDNQNAGSRYFRRYLRESLARINEIGEGDSKTSVSKKLRRIFGR